ncbi:uncharacterized protein LOC143145761 isoform X2 [Ptiloglossa arizonensis]|uniref:uncharacterized protein LOC143145761 isoform X2 n=1 Tax=Ptiloglossa arizonensis TaxID=3350558 RepID=UPI003FA07CEA
MNNLEQQCEDALFKLCDARERYPLRCSNQLKESIQLNSDMHMMKVFQKLNIVDKSAISEHVHFNINIKEKEICFEHLDCKLQNIVNKLDNLKAVLKQVEREKTCEMNKLLKG